MNAMRMFVIENKMMTRESAMLLLPSLANAARKAVEAASSAMPRPLSRMPNALPCSVLGAQFRVALIIAPQNVKEQVIPQKP